MTASLQVPRRPEDHSVLEQTTTPVSTEAQFLGVFHITLRGSRDLASNEVKVRHLYFETIAIS